MLIPTSYIVLFPVLLHTSVFFALHLLTVIVRAYFIRLYTKDMIADFLTKPLIGQQLYKLRDLLLGYTTL